MTGDHLTKLLDFHLETTGADQGKARLLFGAALLELGAGSTLYFPVFVPGALFSAGDGHALQGDGEVCLTAIEAALTGTFEFHVRRDLRLASPRAETAVDWITMGFDEDLDDAAKAALRDMIALIRERSGLSAQDAYTLCSIAADLRA